MSRPDHATIFSRCCHVFKKKAKAIELPFFAKEGGKKDWADKTVASDAARVRESGAGQLCGGDFVALFMNADHVDQKDPESNLYCFPIQLITILTQLLASRQALLPWGISGSCVIPSLAHLASPLIFVSAIFFPFSVSAVSLGILNVVLAYS